MLVDAQQHVRQVVVDINIVQFTGADQTLDDANMLRAKLSPAEQPVFATHRDRAQRPLQMVGVHGDIRGFQEDSERSFFTSHVVDGFEQWVFG